MKIQNKNKEIYSQNEEKTIGTLSYYSISKCKGKVSFIAYIRDDLIKYALFKNIISMDEESITIETTPTLCPSLDNNILYPTSRLVDKNGKDLGQVTHFEYNNGYITKLYSCEKEYDIRDIISSTYNKIIIDEKDIATDPTEISIHYDDILGKIASTSIYGEHNSPIIVQGEEVSYGNIISAIINCKLIDLLKSIK